MYKKLTRAILLYGCETYASNESDPKQHWKYQRKVFRSMYGPIKVNEEWQIR